MELRGVPEKGIRAAESVLRRFVTIRTFLEATLNICLQTAEKDAWNIESVVSAPKVDKMERFLCRNKDLPAKHA